MNAKQFAALASVSQTTVTNWAREGMPCTRTGRSGAVMTIPWRDAVRWILKREPPDSAKRQLAREKATRLRMTNRRERDKLLEAGLVHEVAEQAIAAVKNCYRGSAERCSADPAIRAAIQFELDAAAARFIAGMQPLLQAARKLE
jgi:phage terminase Nu1 subunit (DNA packaging protein)